jgi:hypothetical protein
VRADASFGKLREPALFVAGLVRALNGASDGVFLRSESSKMGQAVFESPSVFNFYPPDFQAPGTTLDGPQFKLMLTGTILNRANFVNRILFGGNVSPDTTVVGSTGTSLNLQPLQAVAANPDQPDQLLDRLNLLMMHNTLSPRARAAILQAVNAYAATDPQSRVRQAAYLIATSAQYQVEQ